MKILVVTNMYPTADAPAAGIFVKDHVRGLIGKGASVETLAIHGRHSRRQYVTSLPRLTRYLRSRAFDLVHAQHTYCAGQVALAATVSRHRPPLVLTIHEGESFLPDSVRDPNADRLRRIVYSKRVKRRAARLADHLVTVAPGMTDALLLEVPHSVIPAGVDVARFRPLDRMSSRAELGLPPDQPVIFFPASPTRDFTKGYSVFSEAIDLLGSGFHVVTGGAIHPRDMPTYMNAADVVVQASRFEASPMVVKEAMACNRPIVSTDVGDVRDLLAEVDGYFICALDPVDMAAKIRSVFELSGVEIRGRERILQRGLSIEQVAERYLGLYETVIREASGQ